MNERESSWNRVNYKFCILKNPVDPVNLWKIHHLENGVCLSPSPRQMWWGSSRNFLTLFLTSSNVVTTGVPHFLIIGSTCLIPEVESVLTWTPSKLLWNTTKGFFLNSSSLLDSQDLRLHLWADPHSLTEQGVLIANFLNLTNSSPP